MKTERKPLVEMAVIVGVAVAYLLCAQGGLLLATVQQNTSPVWPASGLALAAVYRYGKRAALAIWLGAFFANLLSPSPVFVAAGIATGNTLEALVALYILRRLSSVETEWRFLLRACAYPLAALLGATVSSAFGTFSLWAYGTIGLPQAENVLATWWIGDALGILVFAPFLLLARSKQRLRIFTRRRWLESLALCACVAAVIGFLFFRNSSSPELFIVFPLILWTATRFGTFEVRLLAVVIAVSGVIGTVQGHGPFHQGALNQNLVSLQLFIAALAITAISLGELRDLARLKLSASALLICWAISAFILFVYDNSEQREEARRFDKIVQDAEENIHRRLDSFADLLQSGVSFIAASEDVHRDEWRTYVRTLKFEERFPSTHGIGLVLALPEKPVRELAQLRREFGGHFELKAVPGGDLPLYGHPHQVLTYVEPEQVSTDAIGLDISTEKVRREATEEARDTGEPVAITNIRFVQAPNASSGLVLEPPNASPGLVLEAPAYKAGLPIETVEERRKAIVGWVFVAFVTNRFFEQSIGAAGSELEFAVYDGPPGPSSLELYRSKPALGPFEKTTTIRMARKTFFLGWQRAKGFLSQRETTGAWIAASSTMISLLIAMIISSLQLLGERADEIAREKTALLREREAILRKTTRRLQTLISASPVAIMAVNTKMLVTLWNPACQRIFGWTAEEVLGAPLPFIPKDKLALSQGFTKRVIETHQGFTFEAERLHKDGSTIYVSTSLMPLFDEDGQIEGVLATSFDLTEEREAQRALEEQRASAVHNARLAALGEMASGIAHEINNPLAIIAAHANTLLLKLEKDGGIENDRLLASLQKIETVSFRIARIIKGLRNFARNSEGEPAEIKAIDTIVHDTLEICRERFKNNGIRLDVDVEPNLFVKCQSVQISQVLLNLLNNAFDASVTTKDPWVRIEAHKRRDRVEISIVDSGPGVADEIADRIAEPFFTTKPIGQGTGLGLSISKGIVEQHDGHLIFDRRAPGPTRFVVELPLVAEEEVFASET